jgi:molybdopterin converting factor subunit 1
MKVTVLYFASLRERAGRAQDEEDVPAGTTAGALWERLCARGALGGSRAAPGFAVNGEWTGPERVLAEGDVLALLPPVSGGAA